MGMTEQILQQVLELAKAAGATQADALMVRSQDLTVSQRLGKPEEMQRSEEEAVGLRVFVGQKIATAVSSDFSADALKKMAEKSVAMAKEGIDDEYASIAAQERLIKDVPELELNDPAGEPDIAHLRERCAQAEDAAMSHEGITNSEGAEAGYGASRLTLATSNGLLKSYGGSHAGLSVCVLAGAGDKMQRDYAYSSVRYLENMKDPAALGHEAAERTLRRMNPQKVKTQKVPVVFDPRIGKRMVSALCGAISGASVARGTSFLKDKMGAQIFAEGISITDDPLRLRGLASKPFDGEGLPTQKLELVKNGVLQHWLLDLRSAAQLGLTSNARASRGLGSSPSPSATNCYIEAGQVSVEELLGDIDAGLYVTDAFGGGANIVTGDFSLGVSGLWIEKGEKTVAVSEITIAGELLPMYQQMRVADDLVFDGSTCVPTLRIDGMTVAGS
jgi:PmbA protein